MKNKKTASANLESKRIIFFQIGIIISLAIVLTAFEWSSSSDYSFKFQYTNGGFVIPEDVPITVIPKKPIPKSYILTNFNPIPDDLLDDGIDLEIDVSINENTEIAEYFPELEEEVITEEDTPVGFVQDMPEFPGGISKLLAFLEKNIKYPIMAVETGIEGIVYVEFVVEKDGSITDVRVLRSIGGGCDEEAIRVIKKMPKWKPGYQFNKTVRVRYTLPVKFVLQK